MRQSLTTIAALTMLSSIGCVTNVGQPAPDFDLSTLKGRQIKLSELRNKPVVLSFFGAG